VIRLAAILAIALAACGGKTPAATTPDPVGGEAYGGDTYGAGEPTGEPRPDPCGGDPDGY
jgi:hypothetical protein